MDDQYRFLEPHEMVIKGDEYSNPPYENWIVCCGLIGGSVLGYSTRLNVKFRRPIIVDEYQQLINKLFE
jgi:hypothetical protein